MSNLNGIQIKESYGGVLNVGPSGATGSTLRQVTDGFGNNLPIQVSDTEVVFTGDVSGVNPPLAVEKDGVNIVSGTTGINFIGSGVSVTATGTRANVTIASTSGTAGTSGQDTSQVITNDQSGDYTLVLQDRNKNVRVTNSAPATVTIPLESSVNYPAGTQIIITRGGTGEVGVTGAAGVTLNASGNRKRLRYQYSGSSIIKINGDEWYLFGETKI